MQSESLTNQSNKTCPCPKHFISESKKTIRNFFWNEVNFSTQLSKYPRVPKVFVKKMFYPKKTSFPKELLQKGRKQFWQPWRGNSLNLQKCLTKIRKPFLEKVIRSKKLFFRKKTCGHVDFIFDNISGNSHKKSGKTFSLRVPKHSYKEVIPKCMFLSKKFLSPNTMQLPQPWQRVFAEWPHVFLSKSKNCGKIKRFSENFSPQKFPLAL